ATLSWTVTNQGPIAGTVTQWTDRVLFSTNTEIGDSDDVILGNFVHGGALAGGDSYTQQQTVTLPVNRTGHFFLFVKADALGEVSETPSEVNNVSAPAGIDVDIPYADLVVEAVSSGASSAVSGDPVAVTWRVRNQGNSSTTVSTWTDRVVLSSGDV